MQDSSLKEQVYGGSAKSSQAVKEAERRGTDRHVFTASADVTELSSGARFTTRTTDLGPGGCFVDTTVPFPVGAKLRLTVHKGKREFSTEGNVVYSQQGLGMGIAFAELNAEQRRALDAWLAGVTSGRQHPEDHNPLPGPAVGNVLPGRAALVRLVQTLVTKAILTEGEASAVLCDPVL